MSNIFSNETFAINEIQECIQELLKVVKVRRLAEEVNHIYTLIHIAEMDETATVNYEKAVKKVCGDAYLEDIFANEQHRRLHAKAVESLMFVTKEICFHNSLVYKKTGKRVLSRRYDVSRIKDCKDCIEEFKLYATLVATECYIAAR